MKIAILCTGMMELKGLANALKCLFPGHDFVTLGEREAMPGAEAEPFPEFASKLVDDEEAIKPESVLRKRVIPRIAGTLFEAYDRVVLLSDLELENMGRAPHVCDVVKHAVRLHLQNIEQRFAADTARAFRERASFHLAVPMADTWLFGDPEMGEKKQDTCGSPTPAHPRSRSRGLLDGRYRICRRRWIRMCKAYRTRPAGRKTKKSSLGD